MRRTAVAAILLSAATAARSSKLRRQVTNALGELAQPVMRTLRHAWNSVAPAGTHGPAVQPIARDENGCADVELGLDLELGLEPA